MHNLCTKGSYQGHKIIFKGFFLIEHLPVAVKFNWLYKTWGLEGSTLLCNPRSLTKALPTWQQPTKMPRGFYVLDLSHLNLLIRNSPSSYIYRTIIWQRWEENQKNQELTGTSQKQSWWAQQIFTLFWKTVTRIWLWTTWWKYSDKAMLKATEFHCHKWPECLQTGAHLASNPLPTPTWRQGFSYHVWWRELFRF